nr:hypothetical protein [Escherichia coli]
MDTKTASDYLPQTNWPTTQLPPGYTCAEPYLFPDINKPDGPATAGIDDLGEILAKEGANKQVISSQADSLIKISRIWADFFPANTSNQPI